MDFKVGRLRKDFRTDNRCLLHIVLNRFRIDTFVYNAVLFLLLAFKLQRLTFRNAVLACRVNSFCCSFRLFPSKTEQIKFLIPREIKVGKSFDISNQPVFVRKRTISTEILCRNRSLPLVVGSHHRRSGFSSNTKLCDHFVHECFFFRAKIKLFCIYLSTIFEANVDRPIFNGADFFHGYFFVRTFDICLSIVRIREYAVFGGIFIRCSFSRRIFRLR